MGTLTLTFIRKLAVLEYPYHDKDGDHQLAPSGAHGGSQQVGVHTMGDNMAYTSGPLSSFNTKIIIVTTCLLLVLILALLLHFFTRWFLRRLLSSPSTFVASSFMPTSGLKKGHLNSLPTITYMCQNGPHGLHESNKNQPEHILASFSHQCPICLVDFNDGERIRVLPKCEHSFHVSCIDPWLLKHASCPICRGDLMDGISKTSS